MLEESNRHRVIHGHQRSQRLFDRSSGYYFARCEVDHGYHIGSDRIRLLVAQSFLGSRDQQAIVTQKFRGRDLTLDRRKSNLLVQNIRPTQSRIEIEHFHHIKRMPSPSCTQQPSAIWTHPQS